MLYGWAGIAGLAESKASLLPTDYLETGIGSSVYTRPTSMELQSSLTLTQFCVRLTTELFCRAYETLA